MNTKRGRYQIPILAYHQVSSDAQEARRSPGLVVTERAFRSQMMLLRALGYHTLGLEEVSALLRGKGDSQGKALVITFDDGYYGVYESALPILARNRARASVFVIAEDFAGSGTDRPTRAFPILSVDQTKQLLQAGWRLGSHSLTHPHLCMLSNQDVERELIGSKDILETTFESEIRAFAYPYGEHNAEIMNAVASARYQCAVTMRFGKVHTDDDLYRLCRIPVGAAQNLATFLYRLMYAQSE